MNTIEKIEAIKEGKLTAVEIPAILKLNNPRKIFDKLIRRENDNRT